MSEHNCKRNMRPGATLTGQVITRKCFLCGAVEHWLGSQRVYFQYEVDALIQKAQAAPDADALLALWDGAK